MLVPGAGFVERNSELVRQRCQPREHVADLVHLLVTRPLARGLRQLPDFLGEPRHCGSQAPCPVTRAVGRLHLPLQLAELGHGAPLVSVDSVRKRSAIRWRACREGVVVKAWRVHRYGAPSEVLRIDEVDEPTPADGELKIRVTSVTLNFNDLDGIHGRYKTVPRPVPYIPGMEVLGIVEACGAGADAWLGRRVVAIPSGAFGGYAEYVVAPVSMAFEMPPEMPESEAAAIFMPFHLAWLALYERARIQPGETLLVHAGAGGAGSAALQLGVHAGARVFATAGSSEKTKLCLDLGAELAINYRDTDFADAVLDATDGRGVDVAFDAVSGDVTLKTFRCMAFNGRHILAGFASGIEQEDEGLVPRPVLFGNFSLVGVCHAYVDDPVVFKRLSGFNFPSHLDGEQLHAELLELFAAGTLRAIVGQEVPFLDLPAALEAIEQRRTVGRTVVRLP